VVVEALLGGGCTNAWGEVDGKQQNKNQKLIFHCPKMVLPNILVTGTPGTGKTSLCEALSERLGMINLHICSIFRLITDSRITGFQHINIGALVKEKGLHSGFDPVHNAFLINEDLVR
jgi:broad-specificity NMP kinase